MSFADWPECLHLLGQFDELKLTCQFECYHVMSRENHGLDPVFSCLSFLKE